MKPFLFNTIYDDYNVDRCTKLNMELLESPYSYKGKFVPRVTTIIADMLAEEYLITWANSVGLYQHKKHTYYRDKATNIGSHVHEAIEDYIQNRNLPDFNDIIDYTDRKKAYNSFNGFMKWWRIIERNNYKILMEEAPLVTSYCGGTLDLLMKINGKIYLIDFKTSSQLSFKHFVQLAAYRRMLYDTYGIIIDGTILLKLDKNTGEFEEEVLNFSNHKDLEFINQCDQLFVSILYGYYNRYIVENNPIMIRE